MKTENATKRQAALDKIEELKKEMAKQQELADSLVEKPACERLKKWADICQEVGANPNQDLLMANQKVFDKDDLRVLENVAKRLLICRVFNEGKVLGLKDRRHYPYHTVKSSGSGLVFFASNFTDDNAATSSSARLSFKDYEGSNAYAAQFMDVEEGIIK